MSVQELLSRYIAEHRAGGDADPVAYLEQAQPGERAQLAALIDAYLERAPRASFDDAAFDGSPAAATVEALERSLGGVSGLWPSLLPALRTAAGLKRRELVARLAHALDQVGSEEKVGLYYHEMEQGLLPSAGVSDRVLEALADLTGSTLQALRDAGRALVAAGARPSGEVPAFARAAIVDSASAVPARAQERDLPAAATQQWDEVDELFRGGAA